MIRNSFTDETVQDWFDARVLTANSNPVAAILTPDVALHRDYMDFCHGTGVPGEAWLEERDFATMLDTGYGSVNRPVSIDGGAAKYHPCRALTLAQPIRVAA